MPPSPPAPPRAAPLTTRERALELCLVTNVIVHLLAMASMALLLLPCLPGGTTADVIERIGNIADHPWLFRLGWLPWQLCAAADLALGILMVASRFLPRGATVAALVFTAIAVVPDQTAEFLWVTRAVDLARAAHQSGDIAAVADYLAFEARIYPLTAGWGALFYTLGALGWTWAFYKAGTWSRLLTILSVPLWIVMLAASLSPLLPLGVRPSPAIIGAENAVGFLLFNPWLILVTEQVLRRARPTSAWGRYRAWRHPSPRLWARALDAVAGSRFLECVLDALPVAPMASEIEDVVYVSYLVPASVAEEMVPPGLELDRLGKNREYALFTFLTYRHGHFGPALLGRLGRKLLMPSPVQTNWRVHVVDPASGARGITFITNAIDNLPFAVGARLCTAGMPMHVLARATLTRDAATGALDVVLDPGGGSAPDARLSLRPAAAGAPDLPAPWRDVWPDFRAFLAYCVPQDRALSSDARRVTRQEISLGIPIDRCVPLEGTVASSAAQAIAGEGAAPLCFHVSSLRFRFTQEAHHARFA